MAAVRHDFVEFFCTVQMATDGNQKSGINSPGEVKVVEIPLFIGFQVSYMSGGAGFLNHEQY